MNISYIGKLFGIDQETSVRRPSIVVVGGCLGQQGKYSRPRERVAGGKAGKEVCPLAQIAQPHFLPDKTAAAEASGWALLRSLQLPALPDRGCTISAASTAQGRESSCPTVKSRWRPFAAEGRRRWRCCSHSRLLRVETVFPAAQ